MNIDGKNSDEDDDFFLPGMGHSDKNSKDPSH
jgi:hypothetical protein